MNEHDNGGPAFPSSNNVRVGEYASNGHAGMTLRDYFAAKAMQAVAIPSIYRLVTNDTAEGDALVAKRAYEIADAMLKAREAK